MFDEKGELDGNLFLREQKVILKKQKSFVRECKSSDFLHTETFGEISKPRQTTSFLHHIKPWFYSKFSTTHTNFHFHRNKDNVQSSFSSTTCGGKPALQLRFFAKPDSAFNPKLPLRTGSKPESWFSHGKATISIKSMPV